MDYTNSSMVTYTKLSPNHSGQRTHSIDRITPHCVVGQCTAEGLGEWFAKSSTQASSNYGIDRNGRVGMYVEEKNRSWCSSSSANDHRAVTIECASDTTAPYAFNDAVYSSLTGLCTDICRRNGKKKLLWLADKTKTLNYTPASDEMVLTVHRWFANKSCPGDWMYARMGDLAAKVTAALGDGSDASATDNGDGEMTDVQVYAFFKAQGLNDYGTAGLMGNLYAESAMHSNNLQQSYEKSLGMTDDSYTTAVDNGSYTNFVNDSAGYGLAQWTYRSRKQTLLDYAKSKGVSISNKRMQCECIIKELNENFQSVLKVLKTAVSVCEASDSVLTEFECPADQSDAVKTKRADYGQKYYDLYAGWPDVESEEHPDVTYRVHTVVKGDTLFSIAAKYLGSGTRYREIVQLNGLSSNVIYVGSRLKIPNK